MEMLTILLSSDNSIIWTFAIVLVILLIIFIPIYLIRKSSENEQDTKIQETLKSLPDFSETDSIHGRYDAFFYLSFDDTHEKVLFLDERRSLLFDYANIVSASLKYGKEEVVTKKSTLGSVGGAIIGEALAGGVGAIVGSGMASSTSQKKIESLSVHILLRNMENPKDSVLDLVCYPHELTLGDLLTEKYEKMAGKIMDLLTLAIDKAEKKSTETSSSIFPVQKSMAAELKELAALKEQGVLSDEEFEKAKAKLLS